MTIDEVLTAKPLSAADRAQVIEDSLRGAPQAKNAWPNSTSQEDIRDAVRAIDVPTVIIAGEADRVDTVNSTRSELLPCIPGAVLHVLPETGHLSPMEAPLEIAQLIDQFVAGLAFSDKSAPFKGDRTLSGVALITHISSPWPKSAESYWRRHGPLRSLESQRVPPQPGWAKSRSLHRA